MHSRIALTLVLLGACSPSPAPVASSSNDPSSPSAPPGTDPMLALARPTKAPPPAEHAHEGHDHAGTVYACPMHPEVTSDKPEQVCPKCNMKLVPKQP